MMDERLRRLTLIAHRGYPRCFPENTILGYRQAVVHGAAFIETDVQLTRDGVPVLFHDRNTRRLTGEAGTIGERSLDELRGLSSFDPERFGSRFRGTPISTLEAFAGWLANQPGVTAFIEIKRLSLETFGIDLVVERVMSALSGIERRCVLISFNDYCMEHVAARHDVRTGWVLPHWHEQAEARARDLSPDFLFADQEQIPQRVEEIWQGPWQWVVYGINDLETALSFVDRGVYLVETDAIGDMMDQYRAGYLDTP